MLEKTDGSVGVLDRVTITVKKYHDQKQLMGVFGLFIPSHSPLKEAIVVHYLYFNKQILLEDQRQS